MRIIISVITLLIFIQIVAFSENSSDSPTSTEWTQWRNNELGLSCDKMWDGKSENVVVPEQVDYWWRELGTGIDLFAESYIVDENSLHYSVQDGVLFSKDMTVLYRYPPMRPDTQYVIPSCVSLIEESAFADCYYLNTLIIPESVTYIGYDAFNRSRIKCIVFPKSIQDFSVDAISWMPSLEKLVVHYDSIVYKSLIDSKEYIDFFGLGKVTIVTN